METGSQSPKARNRIQRPATEKLESGNQSVETGSPKPQARNREQKPATEKWRLAAKAWKLAAKNPTPGTGNQTMQSDMVAVSPKQKNWQPENERSYPIMETCSQHMETGNEKPRNR